MNLLQLVQEFCLRTGLPQTTFVVGSFDPQITQLQGLMNELLESLQDRAGWQGVRRSATFLTTGTELQGDMETLAPGFDRFVNESFFNRSKAVQLRGPVSPIEWQRMKASATSAIFDSYMVQGNKFYLTAPQVAGQTIAFEYFSRYMVTTANGATPKALFTLDTDICVLPDRLLLAGLRWRWKKEKGLEYAEEFSDYEILVANFQGRDGAKKTLSMDPGACDYAVPGIVVPSGNWAVP